MSAEEQDASPLREDQEELYRLSGEEMRAVEALRERLASSGCIRPDDPSASEHERAGDFTLARFLRARKLDVEAAARMYEENLEWRRENRVDELTRRDIPYKELLRRLVSNAHHGHDRHGRPIYMEKTGRIHAAEFARLIPDEVVVTTHIHMMETCTDRMREEHERSGRAVHQLVTVQDMSGISLAFRKLTYLSRLVSEIDQARYPERLGALYMIKCPRLFPVLWAMVRPFIDAKTRRKIHILGEDLSEMVDDLGPDCLPVEWGGTCSCDGGCLVPLVSREELLETDLEALISEEDRAEPPLTERRVAARGHFETELRWDGPGAGCLKWYFRTAAADIAFSATWLADGGDGGEAAVVVAEHRVDSHRLPQANRFDAGGPGVLTLRWSNHFSRFTAKTLRYNVAVAGGGGDVE